MRGEMRLNFLLRSSLAVLLLGTGPSLAHHDAIPDPPPLAATQPLPTGLRLDPRQ
jgi:hypothetical protein